MKARIIRPSELDPVHLECWQALRRERPCYANPFFSPRFTQVMGDLRSDVRVAVIEDAGRIVGFFPYHQGYFGLAMGLGMPVANMHGPVLDPATGLVLADLVRLCGLSGYGYTNMPLADLILPTEAARVSANYLVDLSAGSEAYFTERRTAHPSVFKKFDAYARRAERDHSSITVECGACGPDVTQRLLELKRDQYQRTRSHNILKTPWIVAFYEWLLTSNDPDLHGLLSAMRFDGQVVAAGLDVVSGDHAFAWLAVFDPAYRRFSPGHLLCVKTLPDYKTHGVRLIDFGVDYGYYKEAFANDSIPMLAGFTASGGRVAGCADQFHRGMLRGGEENAPVWLKLPSKLWQSLSYVAVTEADTSARLKGFAGRVTSRFHKGD